MSPTPTASVLPPPASAVPSLSRPSATSRPVLSAIETLSPHLRLSTLLRHLHTLSSALALAQSRTAPFPDIHQSLQRLSLTTLRLTDRTASTLAAFRHAAATSLHNLDLVSDLLHDDLARVAHSLLSAEAASADRLAVQSRALALEFDAAADALSAALLAAADRRVQQQAARARLADSVASQSARLHRARDSHTAAEAALAEAALLYDAAEAKEAAARFKASVIQAAKVAALVGSVVSTRTANLGLLGMGGVAALASQVDAQVLQAREERAVHLKHKQDARQERLESAQEASELAERLQAVRGEETVAKDTLEALEDALQALRELGGVMLRAETFWQSITEHMEGGGVGSVLGIVKSGAELEEKERKALWKSPSLVTTTTAVQAQWVALQSICDGCIAGLGAERDKMSTKVIQADEGGTSALKQGPVSVRKGSGLALEAASSEDSHDTGPGALASAASSEGDEGCTLLKHEKGPYSRNAGE